MAKSEQWVMGFSDDTLAYIENDEGHSVARVERLGRFVGDGTLNWVHETLENDDHQRLHATTDTHWQSIIDQIAAVPEMVAALRNVQHELKHDGEVHHSTRCDIDSLLKRVDPPCPVTRTVNVTMQVDVRVFSDAPDDVVRAMALAQVRKGDGFVTGGKVIS
jgi:hypothetical protein